MPTRKALPSTRNSLVLRADFSDEAAWKAICSAIQEPVGEFRAYVECVSDKAFDGVTPAEIPSLLPSGWNHSFVFLVDRIALASAEKSILVVDLYGQPAQAFRVIPREAWSVENNLNIANMDFTEFSENVDSDGVFRGFRDT
jgi:hypothetical protein